MINLLSGLYNIDVSNHSSYLGSICKEMVNGIPGVIFSSILIYDDNDKKVIYQEIECDAPILITRIYLHHAIMVICCLRLDEYLDISFPEGSG